HLHAVARDAQRDGELVRALASGKVVVGAVGPTCSAVLQAYGIHPQVTPDHPKMGPLVLALLRHLQRNRPAPAAAPSPLQPAAPPATAAPHAYAIRRRAPPDHPTMPPPLLAPLPHLQRNRPAPAAAPRPLQPAFTHCAASHRAAASAATMTADTSHTPGPIP